MSEFTIGSQWKARGGRMAVVVGYNNNYAPDSVHAFSAVIEYGGGFKIIRYTSIGTVYMSNCDKDQYDLIEPWKEPVVHEGWVNFYPDYISEDFHVSHRIADDMSGTDRIACIKIKFTEGEGL